MQTGLETRSDTLPFWIRVDQVNERPTQRYTTSTYFTPSHANPILKVKSGTLIQEACPEASYLCALCNSLNPGFPGDTLNPPTASPLAIGPPGPSTPSVGRLPFSTASVDLLPSNVSRQQITQNPAKTKASLPRQTDVLCRS